MVMILCSALLIIVILYCYNLSCLKDNNIFYGTRRLWKGREI